MSSPEARHSIMKAVAVSAALLLSACTAQPLYSRSVAPAAAPSVPAGTMEATLGSVYVRPVTSRAAQEVRNELIFLMSGGRGNEAASAPYTLALSASSRTAGATVQQLTGVEQAPNSSVLTFTGSYVLTDTATKAVVGRGQRQSVSTYDVPRQPFAASRAALDASNRAARELAAQIAAAIAADLATGRNVVAPASSR